MNLENILTSGCRQKILKALDKEKYINIMGLVRKINSTYIEVNRNIQILKKENIITEQHLGRVRMIKLNRDCQKTSLLLQALKILEPKFDEANPEIIKSTVKER